MKVEKRFEIDFFELSFLTEACVPNSPIARHCFWMKMVNKYYHQMNDSERARLHEWMNRNWKYTEGLENENEYVLVFENRYNPDNQYSVEVCYEDKVEVHEAFLHNGRYHTSDNSWIREDIITKVEKL